MAQIMFGNTEEKEGTDDFRYGRPWDEGDFDAEILDISEGVARSGNDKIVVVLGFTGPEGGVKVDCHLALTEKAYWKVDEFLKAFNPEHWQKLNEKKEEGGESVEYDFTVNQGRKGKVRVGTRIYEDKKYPEVKKFLASPVVAAAAAATTEVEEDEIPF